MEETRTAVANWWDGQRNEHFWVEIRKIHGIGSSLWSRTTNERGRLDPWYELVNTVRSGDVIYHYSAREQRFVGRTIADGDAFTNVELNHYEVTLKDFEPIVADVSLQVLRARADLLYEIKDQLLEIHGNPLRLPFQFKADRSQFAPMSNYFAKLPSAMAHVLFGDSGVASEAVRLIDDFGGADEGDVSASPIEKINGAYLSPFKPKADTDYAVNIIGGRRRRTRSHETLVNACAVWLDRHGLTASRNAAIDLGLETPPAVIEAKIVGSSWSSTVREAVGQLYEYRYFQLVPPDSELILLVDRPIPHDWFKYLEEDRKIGSMWPEGDNYFVSRRAGRVIKKRAHR